MAVKISWSPDLTVPITEFVLTKSVDKGQTFLALVTIPYDTAPASLFYDRKTKRFYYNDLVGNPGDIYQILANGFLGTSKTVIVVAPPTDPDVCTIIGYLSDAFGTIDPGLPIHVYAYGSRAERWAKNPAGLVAQNPQALGIADNTRTVYPNAAGIWQVELVQGTYARVHIPAIEFSWAFEVPKKLGPVNVRDIPQLRGSALGAFPEMQGDSPVRPES